MGLSRGITPCLPSSLRCIFVPLPLPCWRELALGRRRYAIGPPAAPPAPEEEESGLASAVSPMAATRCDGCGSGSEHEARRRAKRRRMMQKQRIASQFEAGACSGGMVLTPAVFFDSLELVRHGNHAVLYSYDTKRGRRVVAQTRFTKPPATDASAETLSIHVCYFLLAPKPWTRGRITIYGRA